MSTADEFAQLYLQEIGEFETVSVKRYAGTGASRTETNFTGLRARIMDFQAEDLVGGLIQGKRKVIMLGADATATVGLLPIIKGDRLVIRGKEVSVEEVDDSTRRVGGVLIALEITVAG